MQDRVSTSGERRRSCLSCDGCRKRKVKCTRIRNNSCSRCERLSIACTSSNAKGGRPYYQTSKEQFELMTTALRHFLPDLSLERGELRQIVADLTSKANPVSSVAPESPSQLLAPVPSGQVHHDDQAKCNSTENSAQTTPDMDTPRGDAGDDELLCQVLDGESILRDVEDHDEVQMEFSAAEIASVCSYVQTVLESHGNTADQLTNQDIESGFQPQQSAITDRLAAAGDSVITSSRITLRDAMDILRYDTGSSWPAFFYNVHSTLSSTHGQWLRTQPIEAQEDEIRDGRKIDPVYSCDYATRRQFDQASAKFFAEINSITYILGCDQLQSYLTSLTQQNYPMTNASLMLLYLVLNLEQDDDEYFDKACHLFDAAMEEGSIESVRAMMLLAIERLNRNQRNLAWIIIGCGLRIAQSLGLNMHESCWQEDSRLQIESQKRLWWSLFDLEILVAGSVGRPPGGYEAVCDVSLPSEMSFEVNPYSPPGHALASAQLSKMFAHVVRRMYSQICSGAETDNRLEELQHWWDQLPVYLKPGCPTAPCHTRAINYLGLRYYYTILLLTRPYLLEYLRDPFSSTTSVLQRAEKCETANRMSICLLKEMAAQSLLSKINPLDSIYILANGMILFMRVIHHPSAAMTNEMEEMTPLLATTEHLSIGKYATKVMHVTLQVLKSTFRPTIAEVPVENTNMPLSVPNLDGLLQGCWDSTQPLWPFWPNETTPCELHTTLSGF
ncbi:hypothetical protein DL95DRAFT_480443 [Leptodontidium sp. 2 PMI_412]|nr:hypothetical protein DL95DRAFT_480443 [Leptodontidium sp. 2 PMI_412]